MNEALFFLAGLGVCLSLMALWRSYQFRRQSYYEALHLQIEIGNVAHVLAELRQNVEAVVTVAATDSLQGRDLN